MVNAVGNADARDNPYSITPPHKSIRESGSERGSMIAITEPAEFTVRINLGENRCDKNIAIPRPTAKKSQKDVLIAVAIACDPKLLFLVYAYKYPPAVTSHPTYMKRNAEVNAVTRISFILEFPFDALLSLTSESLISFFSSSPVSPSISADSLNVERPIEESSEFPFGNSEASVAFTKDSATLTCFELLSRIFGEGNIQDKIAAGMHINPIVPNATHRGSSTRFL
mmetsp:Transcript_12412/g.18529  ORF Transcript_12412/g.18529 Transcript_12412/m.18529 type:complete len:226 (+) Transcript_12412:299-976(+)